MPLHHPSSSWNLSGTQASFDLGDWLGQISLNVPAAGLALQKTKQVRAVGLMGVDFLPPHEPFEKECFVRQGDLIVAYPQRDDRKFSLQLDYRLLESSAERLLIELWVSIQTYLLDSRPAVAVQCSAAKGEATNRAGRPPGQRESLVVGKAGAFSWAWLIHPRDEGDTTWHWDESESLLQARLFGHFMEKGVIRRARMRCLVGSSSLASFEIDAAYNAFVDSPLPLTA